MNKKNHWENIYQTKAQNEVSWYQTVPEESLTLIRKSGIHKNSSIIDIGGGDTFLADHLLELGFQNISLLDLSGTALSNTKKRLNEHSEFLTFIEADVLEFNPAAPYQLWHDRAAFHFINDETDVQRYVKIAARSVVYGGSLIIGTFSENGPTKCSGIEIHQYSKDSLANTFSTYFERKECFNSSHHTPSGTIQDFTFCRFVRNSTA